MLLFGHLGYSTGAVYLLKRKGLIKEIDFRLVMLASLLPDIIDRFVYLFLPDAQASRLFAHTLLFHLFVIIGLIVVRQRLWIYGVISLGHLLLDGDRLKLSQAFYPLCGRELEKLNIVKGYGALEGLSFEERLIARLEGIPHPYLLANWDDLLLEAGGFIIFLTLLIKWQLYHPYRLKRFVLFGAIEQRRK